MIFRKPLRVNKLKKLQKYAEVYYMEEKGRKKITIHKQLSKLYLRENPQITKVHPYFDEPQHIKKHLIDKQLLELYKRVCVESGEVVLFTWVIPDGFGDYYAQLEAADILTQAYPSLRIKLVTLIHKDTPLPATLPLHSCCFLRFKGIVQEVIEPDPFSQETLEILRNADLILQLPTYYPYTQDLLEQIRKVPSQKSMPKYELLGEFGWIDRPYFNPKTAARCMGLHPLEKGIFLKKIPVATKKCKNRFNLAYTKTQQGGYLYLYALLKATEHDSRDLDIAFFDMSHMLENVPSLFSGSRWGLKTVHLFYKNHFTQIPLAQEGKILRLYHKEQLPHSEFLTLLSQSEDLIGCTGDGSISEAISSGSMYFIDPLLHQRAFVKDLLLLAKTRIPEYREAIEWIRLMIPSSEEKKEWLEEQDVQALSLSLQDRGEKMGVLLQNPRTKKGIQKLSKIICKEHSVNDFLCHLVNRTLVHAKRPELEIFEAVALDGFLFGDKSAITVLREISEFL